MTRLLLFLAYLLLAVATAGLFGALHDQISYTVAPEYFTRFKFIQFDLLDERVPERLRVAAVGFLASWWMGVPIGLLAGLAGFVQRDPRDMKRALLWSLPLIVGFTLAFALGGLGYGFLQTRDLDLADYAMWFVPENLAQPRNYVCVGYMHNAAYLGGMLAIPLAWLFHLGFRLRGRRAFC